MASVRCRRRLVLAPAMGGGSLRCSEISDAVPHVPVIVRVAL
jgi:hypothetical protein